MKTKSKTVEIYILIVAVAIEAISAIYGGVSLMNDPSGDSIQLPIIMLEGTIFSSYLVPGIILFLLLGFFPLFLIFPLIFKPDWPIINGLNIYKSYHWAWTYTLYSSIMLIIWINVQMIILGTGSLIQGYFGLFGVFMLIITLTPGCKRYYRIHTSNHRSLNTPK
jgi:hypothetical protein